MGNSKSKSSTSTQQEDNRVIATEGGVALSKGATLNFSNEFSSEVQEAFNSIVDLARDTGTAAKDIALKSIANSSATVSEISTVRREANSGQSEVLERIAPFVAVGFVAFALMKKKR